MATREWVEGLRQEREESLLWGWELTRAGEGRDPELRVKAGIGQESVESLQSAWELSEEREKRDLDTTTSIMMTCQEF